MRVLLVEDDELLGSGVSDALARAHYPHEWLRDGRTALRAALENDFDLIILDMRFPRGEDGVTLARRLRAQYATPLIVLSGKSATIDKVVCLELGADDYVTKPFEPRELLARIRTVLRRVGMRVGW